MPIQGTHVLPPGYLHRCLCGCQGVANYYNVNFPNGEKFENIVWWYRVPLPECAEIKGFVAFYDEKVDVWVDGVLQQRPGSK